ncbi:ParA family protein [Mycoplasma amphoriforme]|uniref:AAA domain-containing protein n=1 Tax=Mycoplasma amphoriforme A39 TaxID=572419 RepID=A0A292IHK3_9MOLU|nr:unnamed protein product [Mycoplasma amphoriforme A39]
MIISFINNKGGVLKTTLSTNIAGAISKIHPTSKTVIIDLDGQGNVSATFGQYPEKLKDTLIDILYGKKDIQECILNVFHGVDILPCNSELNYIDLDISSGKYKASTIINLIKDLEKMYDYVIIDTPPAMSLAVLVAMRVSRLIVIPFEPDQYSILGLRRIAKTIDELKVKKNSKLSVLVVPTKVNLRTRLHSEVIDLVKKKIPMSKNFVSYTTKSAASVGYEKLPIVLNGQKTKYHDEFISIAKEILNLVK